MRETNYNPTGLALPRWGTDSNVVRTLTIPLDTATNEKEFAIGGNCLWAVTSSQISALVNIRFNNLSNDQIPWQRGMYIRGVPFGRIFCSWAAQASDWITFLYAIETPLGIQIENPMTDYSSVTISGTASVEIVKSTTFQGENVVSGMVSGSAYLVLSADTTRCQAILKADPTNAYTVYIGGSDVTGSKGYPMDPGDNLVIGSCGAIYARVYGGTNNLYVVATYD